VGSPLSPRGRCSRPDGLAALLVLFALVAAVWVGGASGGAGSTLALTTLEQQATEQINALRASYGLQPLTFSTALFHSADAHCRQMLAEGYFGHTSSTGASFTSRIESFYPVGSATYYLAGENLFWTSGPTTSSEMISRWMQSPGHRRNLLNPNWRQIGLATVSSPSAPGVYDGLGVTVVTADFGVRS
jgi:serralysin